MTTLRELVEAHDCRCPKCGHQASGIQEWVDHVDSHNPLREWAQNQYASLQEAMP